MIVPAVFASYSKGNLSGELSSTYPLGGKISGWINISLSDEYADSLLTGIFGGNITIKSLLEKNDVSYDCNPSDCGGQYESDNNGLETKVYDISRGSQLIVIKILGDFKDIVSNGLVMRIEASNQDTCDNPLKIDLLDDGVIDLTATNYSNDYSCKYNGGYGCFNNSQEGELTEIQEIPYCNKIKLPLGNSYNLGAYVKKSSTATNYVQGLLNMELYDQDGEFLESCTFASPGPTSNGGELGCYINHTNNENTDYFLCLSSTDGEQGFMTSYQTGNACGFFDTPPSEEYVANYKLFSSGAKWGNVGLIQINETNYQDWGGSGSLSGLITGYINERFEGNCTSGCFIPIRIISDSQTKVSILSSSLKYKTNIGVIETKKFYDATKKEALISIPFTKINIDYAGFDVPKSYGNSTMKIYYKGNEILSKKIEVKKIASIQSIKPTSTVAYQKTLFTATMTNNNSNQSITYNWDWGDGETNQTKTNKAIHRYTDIGNYTIKLTTIDSEGNTNTKSINVNVASPREIINTTINNYKKNLNQIIVQIGQLPQWQAGIIREILAINDSQMVIDESLGRYNQALNTNSQEELLEIMEALSEIYVPETINISSRATSLPYFSSDYIIVDELEEISGEIYPQSYNTIQAINDWTAENLEVRMDYQTISGYTKDGINDILTTYKIRIKPITAANNKIYLVIDDSTTVFSKDYKQYEGGGFYGVQIDSSLGEKTVEFSVQGIDNPLELSYYLSPEAGILDLSRYDDDDEIIPCNYNNICESQLGEDSNVCPSDCKSNNSKIWMIVIVLIIGIITYVIMMWWYRNKYALHLFKNKNDYINIMTYISKSDKANIKEDKIRESLHKSGWSDEQVEYAWKKYEKDKRK